MKKRFMSIITVLVLVIAMVGCSSETTKREVTDRSGNKVLLPSKIEKVISTAPSNTEIISDLGFADKLVAVDNMSADVEGIGKDVAKIDFMSPDAEAIVGLEPDIIIASSMNSGQSGESPFKAVEEAGIPVVYIPSSDSIDGIAKDVEFISDVLGVKEKGDKMVSDMKAKIEEVAKIGSSIPDKDKKNVYFELNPAPQLVTFGKGTFLNEMMDIIGAKNSFGDQKGWLAPSAESVIDKNPDVILTNVNFTDKPIEELKGRDGFKNINAVKNNKVYQIDTNSSSRPTTHILKALDEMASAVYPDKYGK
ncbi:MAG: ABC transporter substrate-binding protein [Clostridioides sp.]|nr:ABC transporter substrate-binding protein [Clostridioides sp.]